MTAGDGTLNDAERAKLRVELFKHWDNGYWTAANLLLVAQGALLAGYFTATRTILDPNGAPVAPEAVASVGVPLAGVVVAAMWMFVLHRKRSFVETVEHRIRDDVQITTSFQGFSSSPVVTFGLPVVFALAWGAVLLANCAS